MPRTNTSFAELAGIFRQQDRFAVLTHYRPDGDAIGSALALTLSLRKLGKQVQVLNEDPVPETLRFLPGSDLFLQPQAAPQIDPQVVVAVDCANRERLGANCLRHLDGPRLWINIDHHRSNEDYGDKFYVDPAAPASGEIVYDFLATQDLPLDRVMGDNLYVAISTDTGSFQYEGVTAHTYEIGSRLIELGVDISRLARETYENYPLRRIHLLRGLLNVMKITHGGRVASWALRESLARETGIKPEDAEGLIDTLRAIQGVIVAAYFEEIPDGKIRISLRSKDRRVDVGKIAAQFGGGGHPLAAGIRMRGSVEEVEAKVFAAIDEAL